MTFQMPQVLVGTSKIRPDARANFGTFLDGAATEKSVLLTEGGSWVWDVLRENGRAARWDVCAVVPHVAGYVREATDYGMLGAGWRRLRRMGIGSWFRLGWQGLLNARGVLRKDFPTLLLLLLELEMGNFKKVHPGVVFLNPQMTDLLLAMDHGKALEKALERIRRGFGSEPGLATSNAGVLLPKLKEWSLEVPYLLTAVHPRGHGMRPSRECCEAALKDFTGKVVANLEGSSLDFAVSRYWKSQHVVGAVYDAAEPALAEWRRWSNWQKLPAPAAVDAAPALVGV